MASKWRIDGVFWICALKKWGQVFTRVGLLVNFYSVTEFPTLVKTCPLFFNHFRSFLIVTPNSLTLDTVSIISLLLSLLQVKFL